MYATIRHADVNDLVSIVEMNRALFVEDGGNRDPFINVNWPCEEGLDSFSGHVTSRNSVVLVAEIGDDIVGYLIGYVRNGGTIRPGRIAELESMFVRSTHRRAGIGHRLVERFVAWSYACGAERISVTAYVANDRAIRFYRHMGFAPLNLSLERTAS